MEKQRISDKNYMSSVPAPSHGFAPGVKWKNRSALGPLDWICIALFWACILAQLIAGFVIVGSRNYAFPYVESGGSSRTCPSGFVLAAKDCTNSHVPANPLDPYILGCANSKLCEELRQCHNKLQASSFLAASVQADATGERASSNLWEALGDHWYIPSTIFPAMVVVGVLWLLAMQYLVAHGHALGGLIKYRYFEHGVNNWMLLVGAGVAILASIFLFRSINRACKVISVAAYGLRKTPSVIIVSLVVKGLYVVYVVMWTIFMIRSAQAKSVKEKDCALEDEPWIQTARYIFGLLFWIFTYVFLNMKTVVCAAGIGAWYFPNGDGEPTVPALKGLQWAFTSSSGAVMFAATIVGITRFIINRINSACGCLPWYLSPIACLWKCLASCCLGVLEMFSKFMLIGQVFSGRGLCGAGKQSFKLVKDRLGEAFITDGVGHSMLSICTYVFSLGIGVAAWVWLDEAQGYQTLTELGWYLIIPVLLAFAGFISCPILTIVLISWLAPTFHIWACGRDGCSSTSQVHAQLVINSVTGALFIGSVCYSFFHFLADVMLSCIDTIFFCFAIEADADVYQGRFEQSVYTVLKDDMSDGNEVPIYKNSARPLEEYEMAPVAGGNDHRAAAPPAFSPDLAAHGVPEPSTQATIGYQGPVRPGGDRISYV
ncbi:hypothetical protein FOL47_010637 [Perkinsus chesapeaki]|uniref:Choline transporter-like protein n=1 Tax=Perkinsus chesapeaki TaxID=330153 RepID=A0A7J6MR02_PERCH|nr:hypothetical protein FOL47_010637 [Perkinsus chesapeaki]